MVAGNRYDAYEKLAARRASCIWGLSKILCNRVPGRRLSIYPETP